MNYSPAYIMAQYLIEEGILSDPDDSNDWPVYVGLMPDDGVVDHNIAASIDTAPLKDGRVMGSGENIFHYGFQILIRSVEYNPGYLKTSEIADALEEQQVAFNAMMIKLDAEAGTLASVDFVSSLGLEVIDADAEGSDAQHKRSFRETLRSALAHRKLANDIIDALSGLQSSMNDSLAALDAGSVNGAHAGFKVSELDPDAI